MTTIRIYHDVEEARRTVLRRRPLDLSSAPPSALAHTERALGEALDPPQAVERIIAAVRERGDAALLDLTAELDGARVERLEVSKEEVRRARRDVPPELVQALELAAERVRAFYQGQARRSWVDFSEGGMGQIVRPLRRVGIHVPGFAAAYPSTVLMTAIPAKVAGVAEVVLATPPGAGGEVWPLSLVAAEMAEVDRVFRVGGAQAVAALAYGTESVPRVDKVCGPGNIFVALAKKAVYGDVDIDGLQGPTETVVLADETADPSCCAADLLAQAEHDAMAQALLLTPSEGLARRVDEEAERMLAGLEREKLARESLERGGAIVVTADLEEAVALANEYAPEHLCLLVSDPWAWLGRIENAGGIFVGASSPEALGDYVAGPSHVMPTGGTARFASPLGVEDFLKTISLVALGAEAAARISPAAARIARAEGLTAHALSLEVHERLWRQRVEKGGDVS